MKRAVDRRSLLVAAADRLRQSLAEDDTPYLDAQLLLCHCLEIGAATFYAALDEPVSASLRRRYWHMIRRRAAGWPVAYLLKKKDFYEQRLFVDRRTLIPRPDSETLVSAALNIIDREPITEIHDAFTGSGAIALALAIARPAVAISASDLSIGALRVARRNIRLLLPKKKGSAIPLKRADILPTLRNIDMIVANPPYVVRKDALTMVSKQGSEPLMALDGGIDGLQIIYRLIVQARKALRIGGYLLIEAADSQAEKITIALAANGYDIETQAKDLGGRLRVSVGRLAR